MYNFPAFGKLKLKTMYIIFISFTYPQSLYSPVYIIHFNDSFFPLFFILFILILKFTERNINTNSLKLMRFFSFLSKNLLTITKFLTMKRKNKTTLLRKSQPIIMSWKYGEKKHRNYLVNTF